MNDLSLTLSDLENVIRIIKESRTFYYLPIDYTEKNKVLRIKEREWMPEYFIIHSDLEEEFKRLASKLGMEAVSIRDYDSSEIISEMAKQHESEYLKARFEYKPTYKIRFNLTS